MLDGETFERSRLARDLHDGLGSMLTGVKLQLLEMKQVMIYRSIHELVNNALKHAGADQIIVQIMQEPDRIAFTVQDNGCGFDPASTH